MSNVVTFAFIIKFIYGDDGRTKQQKSLNISFEGWVKLHPELICSSSCSIVDS